MKKRILALLMSVVMLIGLLPGVALAAEGDPAVTVTMSGAGGSDSKGFESLGKALEYCVDNDTDNYIVTLQRDISSGVFIDVGKNAPDGIVFDLGGHTLTLNPSGGSVGTTTNGFRVLNKNEATVKNGTVVAEFSADNRVKVAFANYGTLTLDDVDVIHSGDISKDTVAGASMVAYTINNGGKLEVKNGSTITNTVTGTDANANWVIAFGDYKSGSLSNIADATIDSSSVLTGDIGVYEVTPNASKLTIDGTLNGKIVEMLPPHKDTIKMNGTLATADIASAVKYVTKDATITLTEDLKDIGSIVLPVGVTIDGNDHTISGNSSFTVAKSGDTVIQNVNFKDIIRTGATKLSAIYVTGLTEDADVTITGCSFDNMEWEAIQVTSSVDNATVTITDNVFEHTDATTTSERHIHIQPGSTGYAMKLTITGNKLYDCDRVKAAIGVYYIKGGTINMRENYVSDVSGTAEGVSTIAVMLTDNDGNYYNANELVLPLMDENMAEVVYSFLAHGTGNNSWKGTFHKTFEEAATAATTLDTGNIVDTIDLVDDITVSEVLDLRVDGVPFNQNGKTITLTGDGSITSSTALVVTVDERYELVTDTTDGYAYSVELKQFKVTFVNDDETFDSTVYYGETVTKPTDPSKEGYSFEGWYNGDTEYDFNTLVTEDITLTAKWAADSQSTSDDGEDPTPSAEPTPSADPTDEPTPSTEPEPTDEPSDEPAPTDEPTDESTDNTPRGNTGTSGEARSSTDTTEPTVEPTVEPSAEPTESAATAVENEDGSISVTIPEGAETVTLPVDAQTAPTDSETATTIDIDLPEGESAKIEIPVSEPSAGVVVVIVHEDGTEEVVTDSIPTEDGITFTASGDVTVKVVERSSDFDDVTEDAWYGDAVDFSVARGIFNPDGTGENKFEPEENTTRAMLFTMLARYAGADTEGGETWYANGMAWAVENGISDGTNPDENVTREQLVTMLYRYAQLIGADVSVGEDTNILSFEDATGVSGWAVPAVQWACGAGIINGYPDGTLLPGNFATRAEIAVIMKRFVELMNK